MDALLGVIFLAALIGGWRQGAFSAGLAAVGITAGLVVGLGVASAIVGVSDMPSVRVLLVLATVVLHVGVGNIVGSTVGSALRDRMKSKTSQTWDSLIGSVLQLCFAVLVTWLISIPVAANLGGATGSAVRESRVLTAIDNAVPSWGKQAPERLAALIDVTGLPPLVSPFQGTGGDIAPPDPADVKPDVIDRVRPSIVHVIADATSCSRRLSGSGYVSAPDYVITNAHVVAGSSEVELDTVLGVKRATVVLYNPEVDLAVLHVPNLGLEPLTRSEKPLRSGDGTIVLGFPASGPFSASPARIRDRITISGPDIYATGRSEREAYTLRGDVRQGNSGGPVTTPDGQVVGVVFGTAVDGSETGYALTLRQVDEVVGEYQRLTQSVSTRVCVS